MPAPETMDEFLIEHPKLYSHAIIQRESRLWLMEKLQSILKKGILSSKLVKRIGLRWLAATPLAFENEPHVYLTKIKDGSTWRNSEWRFGSGLTSAHVIIASSVENHPHTRFPEAGAITVRFRIHPRHILAIVMPEQKTKLDKAIDWVYLHRLKRFGKPIYSDKGKLLWSRG